jgi:hypothetical protein
LLAGNGFFRGGARRATDLFRARVAKAFSALLGGTVADVLKEPV